MTTSRLLLGACTRPQRDNLRLFLSFSYPMPSKPPVLDPIIVSSRSTVVRLSNVRQLLKDQTPSKISRSGFWPINLLLQTRHSIKLVKYDTDALTSTHTRNINETLLENVQKPHISPLFRHPQIKMLAPLLLAALPVLNLVSAYPWMNPQYRGPVPDYGELIIMT